MTRLRRVVALFMSVLLPGTGHFVLGRWRRGVAYFVLVICCAIAIPVFGALALAGVPLMVVITVSDAALVAPAQPLPKHPRLLGALALAFAVGAPPLAIARSAGATFRLPAASMYPALFAGDLIYVAKGKDALARGDIIVFEDPRDQERKYVKRVIAVGGDTLVVTGADIEINGRAVERAPNGKRCRSERDPEVPEGAAPACARFDERSDERSYEVAYTGGLEAIAERKEWTLTADQLFVLGDNRDNSFDSRHFGVITVETVIGRALFVAWNSREVGRFGRWVK